MSDLQCRQSLPPYRSLVNPSLTYDYQTHRLIHLSPQEVKEVIARFQFTQLQKPKTAFQMKYRSLLSDVSLKAQTLSRKVLGLKTGHVQKGMQTNRSLSRRCRSFQQLPPEILVIIFTYVDDNELYRNCLYANKTFYQLAKPFVYRHVSFSSTYRFAQFITCVRLNRALGSFVMSVDLSQIRPGNADVDMAVEESFQDAASSQNAEVIAAYLSQVLAGWRDWKFKTNLHALHPVVIPLSKSHTSLVSIPTQSAPKHTKFSKYFKRRRSQSNVTGCDHSAEKRQSVRQQLRRTEHVHPTMNRFLLSHASSKDLPIGYILHLVNLCPNMVSLNLSSIPLSTDYRVKREFQSKYQNYDLMNNYSKNLHKVVESLNSKQVASFALLFKPSLAEITSSASSIFSIGTLTKPSPKYNSLLPPVNLVAPDIHYARKGDGRVFLSDLSLKSIKTSHLEMVQHKEIFECLQRRPCLLHLNMSSMIWINVRFVRQYFLTIFASDLQEVSIDGRKITLFRGKRYNIGEPIVEDDAPSVETSVSRRKVIDLSNSGMKKNLPWAQIIDTGTKAGERLVYRILNDELVTVVEENSTRERNRRGRVGENYLS